MKTFLFLFALVIVIGVNAQTGPGGVGKTDGTSDLVLWLDANTINQTDGTNVSSWVDQSGYGNSASAPSSYEPVFETNEWNGNPVVRFTAANTDYLRVNDDTSLKPNTISLFVVGLYNSSTNNWSPYIIKTATWSWQKGYGIAKDGSNANQRAFFNKFDVNFNTCSQTAGVTDIITMVYDKSNVELFKNESLQGTDTCTEDIKDVTNYLYLGVSANVDGSGVSSPLDGDIAEAIIIKRNVNSAERIIIHNYLSAKYNIPASANDLYDEDDPANGNYDHDVAGIGRVDASNMHNDAQGTGIVRILNPSNLNDNEFLIWGHDNGIAQATETVDVPALVQARFNRVWRVSEVNTVGTAIDVGNIDIRFDLTGLGSITASNLRLLVDTDNDGIFADETPISGASLVSGNIYQFTGVSAIANNLRFTIATTNTSQTPLPIKLVNFNVENINNSFIKIDWQTYSEINNDYFTIEKSKDGSNWKFIDTIKGAGNSSSMLNYSTIDLNPYFGTSYYRLKQTDFDGKFSYSTIKSINLKTSNNIIKIYPNPAKNQITIIGDKSELETIDIFNVLGQNITNNTTIQYIDNKAIIYLNKLSKGIYYVATKTTSNKVYKQ